MSSRFSPTRLAPLHRRGVVLVIVLLAVLLLAALLAYVLNLGQQTSARIVTQHSADTAAISGAGWVARSMNTVAMNNVGMARMLTLAGVLDAVPQAVSYTRIDSETLANVIDQQKARGFPSWWYDGPNGARIIDYYNSFQSVARAEANNIIELDTQFNFSNYDVSEMTFYNAPQGRGKIWRAMQALDEVSQATVEHMSDLSQLAASQGGRANLASSNTNDAALMLPIAPELPVRRGTFNDFRRPVLNGLLPPAVDDKVTNRGPFDTIFGWRTNTGGGVDGHWTGGSGGQSWSGRGQVPLGSGASSVGPPSRGQFVITSRTPPTGYRTYGIYEYMMREIVSSIHGRLLTRGLPGRIQQISSAKFNYLWNGVKTPANANKPQWVIDFPKAIEIAQDRPQDIRQTRYLIFQVKSRYSPGDPNFLSRGSWAFVTPGETGSARIANVNGWMDPRNWGVSKPVDYIWEDDWTYQAGYDWQIGLTRQNDADGNMVMQTVYRLDCYIFAGIDIGPTEEIRNPFNFSTTTGLPAPTDLDHSQLGPDADGRRRLSFLGVARRNDRSLVWRGKFSSGKPFPNVVAIAQASVFNDHSWDLWTQMWHAQLAPVTDIPGWADELGKGASPDGTGSASDPNEIADLHDYFVSIAPLAPVLLNH